MVYHRSAERGSSSKPKPTNAFANDGSFLEMFKKLQEQQGSEQQGNQSSSSSASGSGGTGSCNKNSSESSVTEPKESIISAVKDNLPSNDSKQGSVGKTFFVGKRRGGRFLPTGKVKKLKPEGQAEEEAPPKDAWSLYLAEVKKYKQTTCEEEGKTRPLVK